MTSKKILQLLFLLAILSPQLVSFALPAPPYSIKDSGVPADSNGAVVWLDNQRIIFSGQKEIGRSVGAGEHALFVWDTVRGGVNRYPVLQGAGTPCVRGDFISYSRRKPGVEKEWLRVYGKVRDGQIIEEQVSPLPSQHWFNTFSCRYYDTRPEWAVEGHNTTSLLEEHGFLDWGVSRGDESFQNTPVTFFSGGSSKNITLPFGRRDILHILTYYPFANGYLVRGERNTPQAVPLWLLKPEGTVTKVLDPSGKSWSQIGWSDFFLTKKKFFLVSDSIRLGRIEGSGKIGKAGGYVVEGEEVRRVIPGMLANGVVSPDGCMVAFVHDPFDTEHPKDRLERITVKMIDLCRGDIP